MKMVELETLKILCSIKIMRKLAKVFRINVLSTLEINQRFAAIQEAIF